MSYPETWHRNSDPFRREYLPSLVVWRLIRKVEHLIVDRLTKSSLRHNLGPYAYQSTSMTLTRTYYGLCYLTFLVAFLNFELDGVGGTIELRKKILEFNVFNCGGRGWKVINLQLNFQVYKMEKARATLHTN